MGKGLKVTLGGYLRLTQNHVRWMRLLDVFMMRAVCKDTYGVSPWGMGSPAVDARNDVHDSLCRQRFGRGHVERAWMAFAEKLRLQKSHRMMANGMFDGATHASVSLSTVCDYLLTISGAYLDGVTCVYSRSSSSPFRGSGIREPPSFFLFCLIPFAEPTFCPRLLCSPPDLLSLLPTE